MTIKELIEQLEEYPYDTKVYVYNDLGSIEEVGCTRLANDDEADVYVFIW